MTDPFRGSVALAAGKLTPYQLRSRYFALHQDVYVPRAAELTPIVRAKACWLRSRGRGIIAGYSASALHGAKWRYGWLVVRSLPKTIRTTSFSGSRRPERAEGPSRAVASVSPP